MRYIVAAVALALAATLNLVAFRATAQTANRAVVTVQYDDGRVVTRCVSFAEPSLTSYDLLRRAGFRAVAQVSSLGAAVCGIEGQGCSNPNRCFCACETLGASCQYWQFFRKNADGGWQYSPMGALSTRALNGSIEAWVWGAGGADGSRLAPPDVSIERACAPGTAPPASPAPVMNTSSVRATVLPTAVAPTASAVAPTASAVETTPSAVARALATATVPAAQITTASAVPTQSRALSEALAVPASRSATPVGGVDATSAPTIAAEPASVDWGSYAVFGAIVAGLGVAIAIARRRA